MIVARSAGEMREFSRNRDGKCVLVPTMGALHAGHLALVERARDEAGPDGTVVVSIFVNPIQFDRAKDLEAYPRTLEADLDACRAAGADAAFVPEISTMYHEDRSVTVHESMLSSGLCGASRPGHFDGVCTVVLKLFLISGCDAAVFGEKDFQQLAVIRRMVRDLDVPVEIIGHPTLREADGLAMSSRNLRLTAAQRADAPRIRRALLAAADLKSAAEIPTFARREIDASSMARVDYIELVDAETLQPVTRLERPALLATAVFYGDVRLIDNILIFPQSRGDSMVVEAE